MYIYIHIFTYTHIHIASHLQEGTPPTEQKRPTYKAYMFAHIYIYIDICIHNYIHIFTYTHIHIAPAREHSSTEFQSTIRTKKVWPRRCFRMRLPAHTHSYVILTNRVDCCVLFNKKRRLECNSKR